MYNTVEKNNTKPKNINNLSVVSRRLYLFNNCLLVCTKPDSPFNSSFVSVMPFDEVTTKMNLKWQLVQSFYIVLLVYHVQMVSGIDAPNL